ncbi:MAG: YihY/virulence factor BrkB family protein, partial [Reyranella sp.]
RSRRPTLSRLVRARLASLGLVATSGFLLTVSLVVSAALAAVSDYLKAVFPAAELALQLADIAISATLLTGLFAAIYKVLPDTPIAWRDVAVGALVTAGLFEGGKSVIALYIGKSDVASSYGAAGALIILLLWIFYSAQIFLLGAEFTRAFARRYGSHAGREVSNPIPS